MPRTVTVLRVFVASPDDVSEEREALEEVVREINLTLPERDEIRLDLVRWETHAYPGVGSDVQAVINEQIGDDYDIFVGIMWKHFGTPTGRAGSGTEEEFQRAYQRYRENPDQIKIMFYFKDAPVTPSAIDTDQLASVNEFRSQLGEQGTLYWSYTTVGQFTSFLRIHLNYQVAGWRQAWGTAAGSEQAAMEVDISSVADSEAQTQVELEAEEPGFLDLIESGLDNFDILKEGQTRITDATEELNVKTEQRTEEISRLGGLATASSVKAAKRIANRSAEDMEQFARRMETEIPIFGEAYSKGIDAFALSATLLKDFTPDTEQDLSTQLEQLRGLKESLGSALEGIRGFRESMASLPRLTTAFNRGKKRAVSSIDRLFDEMRTAINFTSEAEKMLEKAASDAQNS